MQSLMASLSPLQVSGVFPASWVSLSLLDIPCHCTKCSGNLASYKEPPLPPHERRTTSLWLLGWEFYTHWLHDLTSCFPFKPSKPGCCPQSAETSPSGSSWDSLGPILVISVHLPSSFSGTWLSEPLHTSRKLFLPQLLLDHIPPHRLSLLSPCLAFPLLFSFWLRVCPELKPVAIW